jgi:NADH-quinone oxidoreductase subunit C
MAQVIKIAPGTIKKVFLRGYDGHIISGIKNIRPLIFILNRATFFHFEQLVDLVVYDRPGKKYRFTLIYNLLSVTWNNRLNLIIQVDELTPIDSVMDLYPSAGWLEREVWDMFGIFVYHNADLRRILTDYGFSGFPLRKDFPLTGFLETYYSDEQKRIVYQPVELSQEMRQFNYDNT